MREPSAELMEWARRVVEHEAPVGLSPPKLQEGVERAFARLEAVMCTVVGPIGFKAVVERAVHLAGQRFPWLLRTEIDVQTTVLIEASSARDPSLGEARVAAQFWIIGLAGAVEREGGPAVLDCATLLLAHTVMLFSEFIGVGLTHRLLRRVWEQVPGPGSRET